ncbi:cysteine dioxygenase [Kitasatospora aureofaciens]|uniref:cysteine dioxygenase n=1 Tax=Kitasatospora aureofaciens TaxID=1894 RepID=UPI0037C9E9E2
MSPDLVSETPPHSLHAPNALNAPLSPLSPLTPNAPHAPHAPLSPSALRTVVRELAEQPEQWIHLVRLSTDERWYQRLVAEDDHEVWLISWLPGQSTGFHDHGGSRGAFAVALGELEELSLGGPDQGLLIRRVPAGTARAFGPEYVHDVRNTASGPAVTLHAYSPPLSSMAHYDLRAGGLVRTSEEGPEQW